MQRLPSTELQVFLYCMPPPGKYFDLITFKFNLTVYVILFKTNSANTHALKAKRKTILPNDLFQALSDMELEEFVPELKTSLEGVIT